MPWRVGKKVPINVYDDGDDHGGVSVPVCQCQTAEYAKLIVDAVNARALFKLGASKGGKARAESLSGGERKAIAEKAAAARWKENG